MYQFQKLVFNATAIAGIATRSHDVGGGATEQLTRRVSLFSTLLLLHFYIITIRETLNKTKNDAAVVVGHDVDILA